MIRVTKLDGSSMLLNADWIQSVESTPDTLIVLTTGFRLMVRESVEEVTRAFNEYRRKIPFFPRSLQNDLEETP